MMASLTDPWLSYVTEKHSLELLSKTFPEEVRPWLTKYWKIYNSSLQPYDQPFWVQLSRSWQIRANCHVLGVYSNKLSFLSLMLIYTQNVPVHLLQWYACTGDGRRNKQNMPQTRSDHSGLEVSLDWISFVVSVNFLSGKIRHRASVLDREVTKTQSFSFLRMMTPPYNVLFSLF